VTTGFYPLVIWSWLKQNWLALSSFIISAFAFVLSYKKFKHDTRPILIPTPGPEGVEIENVGQVVAVNVTLTLVETVRRPSGILSVDHILRPGEKSAVSAFNWPDALTVELNSKVLEPMSEFVLRMDGQDVRPNGARVASYLLGREGMIVILRFRAADGSKTFTRLFLSKRSQTLVPGCRLLRNRLCTFVIEKWYAKNAELAPPGTPFEFPPPDAGACDPTPKNRFGE
jgi:hypothetical protein